MDALAEPGPRRRCASKSRGRVRCQRPFLLLDQYIQTIDPSGLRQYIVLQDLNSAARITVIFEVYDNQPVLRYS